MDIKLIPINGGSRFVFPSLPEQIKGKTAAKYQSFNIISQGTVKVPKGSEVEEVSWDGEFFGRSKKRESIVKSEYWMEPLACINILKDFMKNETVLNLIITDTWINLDVTISSFTQTAYGAYGNIKYSITFVQKKPLLLYNTSELNIGTLAKKTKPRNEAAAGNSYTVVSGDTLWRIAQRFLGSGVKWSRIYDTNTDIIEKTAKAYGKSSSDHGHWIWPGEVLVIPS